VRIPPNRLANARPLLNLFFSQLVSLNTQQLPERDAGLKFQCLLVNDEFAAMGRVGIISNGRTESAAASHIARERATAVRAYLVGAGVDPAHIRATYQPVGDHAAANDSPPGRALNRRVEIEIEIYRALPVAISTAAATPN
jgi:hypothetical protein